MKNVLGKFSGTKSTKPENVREAILTMQRVESGGRSLDMTMFQDGEEAKTEAQAHACGTVCCFAGWVAISPHYQAQGGIVGAWGEPLRKGDDTEARMVRLTTRPARDAMADYLGIHVDLAELFIATSCDESEFLRFYQVKEPEHITPRRIINRLQALL